jgi:integrase
MGKRRGNGEGSVYKTKDGRWCASLTVGYDENGKRKRRYVYARTKAEVLDKLSRTRSAALTGTLSEPSRLTVGEFAARWLADAETSNRVRVTTARTYKCLLDLHVNPHLSGVRLNSLSPVQLRSWMQTITNNGISPRQRQAAYVLLKTILKDALRLDLITRNPVDAIDKPKVRTKEMTILSAEQIRTLLDAAQGQPLEALLAVAAGSGCRQGELFGLQWQDIDFAAKTIRIRRALVEIGGVHSFGEPKTERSRRVVMLPAYAIEALGQHRTRLGAIPHPNWLVFTDSLGKPLRKSNFTRRVWHPLLKAAKLPSVRFHSLRHSHVTDLLASGADLKAVSDRVGHSRTSMTADVYGHSVSDRQGELAHRLDAIHSSTS